MIEVDACWDTPRSTDVKARELFGADEEVLEKVDNRLVTPIFNQADQEETRMACGSYGMRHLINVCNAKTGGEVDSPLYLRQEFVKTHKTVDYDPIKQGSGLQDQLEYARKLGLQDGYYKVKDKLQIQQAVTKGNLIYTGSKKIDWKATRTSKDNVAVIGTGSAHIFAIDGYDKDYMYCRNSYGSKAYDNGYFRIRWDDIDCLFTAYAVIDKIDADWKQRIREAVALKKKNSVYKTKQINGRMVLGWRPL